MAEAATDRVWKEVAAPVTGVSYPLSVAYCGGEWIIFPLSFIYQ